MEIKQIINSSMEQEFKDYNLTKQLIGKDPSYIEKYLPYIEDNGFKCKVISTIEDDEIKLSLLKYIDDVFNKSRILKNINDENKISEFMIKNPEMISDELVNKLNSIDLKLKFIKYLPKEEASSVLANLGNDDLIKKYILTGNYDEYAGPALAILNDTNFIYDYCHRKNNLTLTLDVIKNSYNEDLREKLLYSIDDPIVKDLLVKNNKHIDSNLNIIYNIDPTITFGLELEAVNEKYAEDLLKLNNILNNWKIVYDQTITNGVEFVSPVLSFNEKSMQELNYVCNYLDNHNFYTDENCGGHIHMGFDYFKDIDSFDNFMKLYTSCEDILYLISNKTNTVIRDDYFKYARKLKKETKGTIRNINTSKFKSLKDYVKVIRKKHNDHYDGLNISNIGSSEKNTIEFRFPNGELDFNEIIANIKLFAKLFEKSSDKELYKLIENCNDEDSKFKALNNGLFDSELDRAIYEERYNTNKEIKRHL